MGTISLVIHGGAGSGFAKLTTEERRVRQEGLRAALVQGFGILKAGGNALDAVTKAVCVLEDCPHFNAGHGAVLAADGTAELDASIMDGTTGNAGGVTSIKRIRNPVTGARAVMEKTPHTIIGGTSAERIAQEAGLALVENVYFITPERQRGWEDARQEKTFVAARALGTVGAAAIDSSGHMAAATSTGGLMNKIPGRVSDSAIPGAGTWAQDSVCAISCTGTGDIFIRTAAARHAAALVEYRGMSLPEACRAALDEVAEYGGCGGMIGIDAMGRVVMEFNTEGMYRGYMTADRETPFIEF